MSNEAERLCNEGLELMTQHKWAEAEKKMMMALDHDDNSPELHYNLGKCLFHQDKYGDAMLALYRAVKLKPFYHEANALMGSCCYAVHDLHGAISSFTAARKPLDDGDFTRECMTARAHCYLAGGDYTVGFEEYEYRLKEPNTWDGTQSLVGKTLLVKAEGGLGDQIFFVRYAHFLAGLGAGYVIWEVDEPLMTYFKNGLDREVVKRGDIVEYDYMVHAGSLPYIFGTKTGTIITGDVSSYIENPKRIGIACSGNPLHPDDHHRSIPLVEFDPLLSLDKSFYLVQKDLRATDRFHPYGPNITHVVFDAVSDLAAVVDELDLVITVDTMTAHLAGVAGIPTWLLLPYAPDWRWGLEGEKTPWYPCMRIFRQGPDRQWGPVIQRVVEELKNG